jgi:bifunctional non-homologous end joining protein LigD
MAKDDATTLEAGGREVVITHPGKLYFPLAGITKLDLVHYYAAVAPGALRGIDGRPLVLKRYVDGADKEPFFQKRAPEQRPDWIETVELRFPSGRTAQEVVVRDVAQLLWIVNLGCIDLNPHPVRTDDMEHPDELRIDLDPGPGVGWKDVLATTLLVREVLEANGLRGWPKTSGSRGMHVLVRIERRWGLRSGAASGAGRRARSRAARARAGDEQVVEGGTPWRLPRLQPERQGSHRGLGVVGASDCRCACLDAAGMGRGR